MNNCLAMTQHDKGEGMGEYRLKFKKSTFPRQYYYHIQKRVGWPPFWFWQQVGYGGFGANDVPAGKDVLEFAEAKAKEKLAVEDAEFISPPPPHPFFYPTQRGP